MPRVAATFLLAMLAVSAFAADLPKCSVIAGKTGGPAIVVDNQTFSPILLVGNNQFKKDDVLLKEIQRARDAGINLFGFSIDLDWRTTPAETAAIVDKFCAANPDGCFIVRVWLGANKKWADDHPDDCIVRVGEDGVTTRTAIASPSSASWRITARNMLEARIAQIAQGPHGNRLFAVMPTYLQTGEWFYPQTDSFGDYSPANLAAFRQWLKKTYKNEKRLRQAWNQPDVTFDSAQFPAPAQRDAAGWGPFRDPAVHQPAIDMQRFQARLVADTIAYFAAAVKDATAGRTLVAAFYGYTFELNHNGPRALAQSGHLSLASLLDCPDVDMVCAPFSYFERGLGQPGHLHAPVNSVALHRKLFICEEDSYTHLAQEPPDRLIAPGWEQRTTDCPQTYSVFARNFGNAFSRGAGVWLFDLLGDGRWNDENLWRDMTTFRRIAAELRATPPFEPEVAFLADEDSVNYLRANTHPWLLQALAFWRSELDQIGAPVGYYLLSDIALLPKSVKVVILPNAYAMDKTVRRALDNFYARGGTCIMVGYPNIIGPSGIELQRTCEIVGMNLKAEESSGVQTIASQISKEVFEVDAGSLRMSINGDGVDVVARYQDSGAIAAAARKQKSGVCVYSAIPRLPVGLLREICARAGVNLYRNTPGQTAVAGNYLFVHTQAKGSHIFTWPAPWKAVERIYPTGPAPTQDETPLSWRDTLPPQTTAIYRVTQ